MKKNIKFEDVVDILPTLTEGEAFQLVNQLLLHRGYHFQSEVCYAALSHMNESYITKGELDNVDARTDS